MFLLIALWAFSKSSIRFHAWLWNHQTFGPSIRDWHTHHVIPRKAKWLAVLTMTASFVYIAGFVATDWILPALMAAILVPVALFIVTRASQAPEPVEDACRRLTFTCRRRGSPS